MNLEDVRTDIAGNPLFAFLAQELKMLTNIIEDRDLDLRMLNRRVNTLENQRAELEWRMESYEAFASRMMMREPDTSTQVVQDIVGDTDYYNGDLLAMLMELETEDEAQEDRLMEDPEFDWDAWFPETIEL